MATGKVNKWDGNAHEALAASLARIHGSITPEQQVALVEDMKKSGFDTTWEGIRQHLQKLKKKDGDNKDGDAPNTPKKTGKASGARARTPATPRQNKRQQAAVDVDEVEDKTDVKKLKLEVQAPNLGQYPEDEPNPPSEGEV